MTRNAPPTTASPEPSPLPKIPFRDMWSDYSLDPGPWRIIPDPTGGCTCPPVWNGVIPPECRIHNPAGRTHTTTDTGTAWSIDPVRPPETDEDLHSGCQHAGGSGWATVDEGNPAAVIVWMLGAIIVMMLGTAAFVVWRP